jgi:hypothetical protein
MIDREFKADLIEVLETGAFKTEHVFQTDEGILGSLSLNVGKTEGAFQAVDEKELTFKKTSPWKSNYEWRDGSSLIGSAVPRKALSRAFLIDFQGTGYGLIPGGTKMRSWRVINSSDQELCEILPRGAFKRGARIRIKAEIPIGLLIFSYCLVNKRWQEQSS